jgi:hypothetical protein
LLGASGNETALRSHFLCADSARTKIDTEAEEVEHEHRRALRLDEVHPLDPWPKPPASHERSYFIPKGAGGIGQANIWYPYENGKEKKAIWIAPMLEFINDYQGEDLLQDPAAEADATIAGVLILFWIAPQDLRAIPQFA